MTADRAVLRRDLPGTSAPADDDSRPPFPITLDPLLENAPLMLGVIDRSGVFVVCNQRWRRYTGIPTPSMETSTWAEPIHGDDRSDCLYALLEAVRELRPVEFEYRLRGANGGYRWVRQTVEPWNPDSDGPGGFLFHVVDVSEHHRSIEILQTPQSRFGSLVNAIPSVIYSTLASGNFECTFASPNLLEVLGYDPDEMVSDPNFWFRHIHPDDVGQINAEFMKPLESLSGVQEYRIRHRNGHYLWIHDRHRVVYDAEGAPIEIVGTWTDISERKHSEQQRDELIAELEAKNAEMERFTYTVSHDLKSPLITIRGFLGMLQKDIATGKSERVSSDIARIHDASEKMQQLLDELLELSRIGRLSNMLQRASLAELAAEAIELNSGRISARGVQVHVAPDTPMLYGDRPRLREVVQNLIDNAVKFMGDQPTPRLDIGGSVQDGMVLCYVRDNGIGIDPRYHHKIFGLFERLGNDVDGTGIGLALVKRIVEVHGGRIWVESEGHGRGSTFWFQIPLKGEDDHGHS